MPSYVVTDPATGIKLRLSGDAPPSGATIRKAFASHYAPDLQRDSAPLTLTPPKPPNPDDMVKGGDDVEALTPPTEGLGAYVAARMAPGAFEYIAPQAIAAAKVASSYTPELMKRGGHAVGLFEGTKDILEGRPKQGATEIATTLAANPIARGIKRVIGRAISVPGMREGVVEEGPAGWAIERALAAQKILRATEGMAGPIGLGVTALSYSPEGFKGLKQAGEDAINSGVMMSPEGLPIPLSTEQVARQEHAKFKTTNYDKAVAAGLKSPTGAAPAMQLSAPAPPGPPNYGLRPVAPGPRIGAPVNKMSTTGPAEDLLIGGAKGAGSTALGLGELAAHPMRHIPLVKGFVATPEEFNQAREAIAPSNTAQTIGKIAEQVGEFALPAGKIAELTAKYPFAMKAFMQGASAGAVGAAQSGDLKGGVAPAVIGAALPVAGKAITAGRAAIGIGAKAATMTAEDAAKLTNELRDAKAALERAQSVKSISNSANYRAAGDVVDARAAKVAELEAQLPKPVSTRQAAIDAIAKYEGKSMPAETEFDRQITRKIDDTVGDAATPGNGQAPAPKPRPKNVLPDDATTMRQHKEAVRGLNALEDRLKGTVPGTKPYSDLMKLITDRKATIANLEAKIDRISNMRLNKKMSATGDMSLDDVPSTTLAGLGSAAQSAPSMVEKMLPSISRERAAEFTKYLVRDPNASAKAAEDAVIAELKRGGIAAESSYPGVQSIDDIVEGIVQADKNAPIRLAGRAIGALGLPLQTASMVLHATPIGETKDIAQSEVALSTWAHKQRAAINHATGKETIPEGATKQMIVAIQNFQRANKWARPRVSHEE